ncbi:MAG: TetR/AcrR family transcriptional regulator [Gammaproteobacteria bacterium]|nr:TetR/AcrR family transcriptional regulator [Gammaproteobacteria bacterium]
MAVTDRRSANAKAEKDATTEHAFLDAAERLFADNGFEGTRVRAIAEEAGANLGALHYYWGSKEALFRAVWERRMSPLITARKTRLAELLARKQTRRIAIEELLGAWIEAGLGLTTESTSPSEVFQRLYGRALTDPSSAVRQVLDESLDESGRMLLDVVRRACPHLADDDIYWRIQVLLGAVLYVHVGGTRMDRMARDMKIERSLDHGARQLIHCLAATFNAPALGGKKKSSV